MGTIVTMAHHPTGKDMFAPGRFESVALLNIAAHSLGLLCIPVLFLGGLSLTRRLMSPDRYSVVGIVFYGFALVAVMNAAVASGLIAPGVGRFILDADAGSNAGASQAWRVAFNLNGLMNQAFAKVFVVASSIAILFWSLAMQRVNIWKPVAIYGLFLAPATILALVSGRLRMDVHGFGMLVVLQAIWFIGVGFAMADVRQEVTASQ